MRILESVLPVLSLESVLPVRLAKFVLSFGILYC